MKIMRYFLALALTILLSGCAGLFVAGAATTANIVTDTRSTQQIWDDNNIELEIAGLGNKAPFATDTRITASAYRGTVVLMGQAKTDDLNSEFISRVKQIKGVRTVYNQVRIKTPLNMAQISEDSWITTKVKSSLLMKGELNGVKIKVITEDKEVFLLGYVSHQQADMAADVARNISGVRQVIKAFLYSDESEPSAVTTGDTVQ